ncbi:MAG: tetratricopeptide repeat protein [Verrucomicrobiota bacterium]
MRSGFLLCLALLVQLETLLGYNWTDVHGQVYNGTYVERDGDEVLVKKSQNDRRPAGVFRYGDLSREDQIYLERILDSEEKLKPLYDSYWFGVWTDGTPGIIWIRPVGHETGKCYVTSIYLDEDDEVSRYSWKGMMEEDLLRTRCHYMKFVEDKVHIIMDCAGAATMTRLSEKPEDIDSYVKNEIVIPDELVEPKAMAQEHLENPDVFHSCWFRDEYRRGVRYQLAGNLIEAKREYDVILELMAWAVSDYGHVFMDAGFTENGLGNFESSRESFLEASIRFKNVPYSNATVFNEVLRAKRAIFNSYWFEGRIAEAFGVYDEMIPLEKSMAEELESDSRLRDQLMTDSEYILWLSANDFHAWSIGDSDEYLRIQEQRIDEMAEVLDKFDLDWRSKAFYLAAIIKMASELNRIGDYEGAAQVLESIVHFKEDDIKALDVKYYSGRSMELSIGVRLGRNSLEEFELFNEDVGNALRGYQRNLSLNDLELLEAGTYLLSGMPEKALAHTNKAVELVEAVNAVQYLVSALQLRARIYIELDRPEEAIADVTRAIEILRVRGTKISECGVYQVYAKALGMVGRKAGAVQAWLTALDLADKFNQHHIAIDVLVDLLEFYITEGNVEAAGKIREEIESRIVSGQKVAEVWFERVPDLYSRLEKLQEFLSESGGTHADSVDSLDRSLNVQDLRSKEASSPGRMEWVTIQPQQIDTSVLAGESALASFSILNLGEADVSGSVEVSAPGLSPVVRDLNDEVCVFELVKGDSEAEAGRCSPMLGSGVPFTVQVIVESGVTEDDAATMPVDVTWSSPNGVTKKSVWNLSTSDQRESLTVVDASLIEDNPFYYVPFLNSIYVRDELEEVVDIFGRASRPCRVEIYDHSADILLAIDANGDGDYRDAGDYIRTDLNRNLLPDLPVAAADEVVELEIWMFNDADEVANDGDFIDYALGTSVSEGLATNRLILN